MDAVTVRDRDLLLIGGGHAHALVLRQLAMQPLPPGTRVTLVSPDCHTPYSGMLPGLLAGHYDFVDTHIDLARLCQWADVRFVMGRAIGIDRQHRCVHIAGRPSLGYDLLSLDIGAQPDLDAVPGAREHAVAVKPVADLWARWQTFRAQCGDQPMRVAVVGGGAGGVELILAMAHALAGQPLQFALYGAGAEILANHNAGTRRAIKRALQAAGVAVHDHHRVCRVEAGTLHFDQDRSAPADVVFWCTGVTPAAWLAQTGLATDARGFVAVRDTLQSCNDPRIFAAGDVATQIHHPRPKAGVYAVRQAPVLAHNLLQALRRPHTPTGLRRYVPQRHFLSLISLGARRATADRGALQATGAWAWRWKDRIDQAFMRRFSDLPPRTMAPEAPPATQQMPCGGCGSKVGSLTLHEVLEKLHQRYPEHALPRATDAGDVAFLPPTARMVQSIDSLRPLISDPFQMGQIAAAHALGDLAAAGARPLAALAQVVLPYSSPALQSRDLEQLLAGALEVLKDAECPLLGGHSTQAPELHLGFVVNGQAWTADAPFWHKHGGLPGDALILTKPLGSGLVFAAQMQLAADGRDVRSALSSMRQPPWQAVAIGHRHGVRAATDISGFGLLAHLREMLRGGLGARLDLSALPLLPGAERLARDGIRSTLHADNLVAATPALLDPPGDAQLALLCDPQTCGGLLLAVPPERSAACLKSLRAAGYPAAQIGRLCADAAARIRFFPAG